MQILRIDMTKKKVSEEPVPEKYLRYGGRGLTSRIIADEVPPYCHPLGPHNRLVISNGLLAGTTAPNSGRISVGAKSPLTGGIKESNVGGNCGNYLARRGIRALVFEGLDPDGGTHVLVVGADGTEIVEFPSIKGKGAYDTAEVLLEKYGEKSALLIVGPAGEQGLCGSALIATDLDGHPSRAAGRGGTGAVLGSKGIKAVVCLEAGRVAPEYADEETFKKTTKEFSKQLIETRKGLTELGTAGMVKNANLVQGMPTRNYTAGSFDRAGEMDGDSLLRLIRERGGRPSRACHQGCVIRCSNVFVDEKGEYVTSSLEYETMVMVGSNLDISDLDMLARIDRAMDDAGLDSIETGAALGVAMEMGMLEWGDEKGVLSLLEEVKKGTLAGKLIGSGAATVGRVLGARRVPEVKGQSMVAYDPRTFKGMGCTYATSPMGADHTAGPAIPGRGGLDPEKSFELTEAEGQVELTRDLQILIAVCDSLGYCFFVGPDIENMKRSAVLLNALYGWDMKYEDVLQLGVSTLEVERDFNSEAGIAPGMNRLPDFVYDEELPPSGRKFDVSRDELRGLEYKLD